MPLRLPRRAALVRRRQDQTAAAACADDAWVICSSEGTIRDPRAASDAGFTAFDGVLRDLLRSSARIHTAMISSVSHAPARWRNALRNQRTCQRAGSDFLDAQHHLPRSGRDALCHPSCDRNPADRQALTTTMRAWTLLQRAAVLDALERVALSMHHGTPPDDAMRVACMAG